MKTVPKVVSQRTCPCSQGTGNANTLSSKTKCNEGKIFCIVTLDVSHLRIKILHGNSQKLKSLKFNTNTADKSELLIATGHASSTAAPLQMFPCVVCYKAHIPKKKGKKKREKKTNQPNNNPLNVRTFNPRAFLH